MVITVDRSRIGIKLTKATEERSADTPLSAVGPTPLVAAGPLLNGGLDKIASAVGHARPEEELAVLASGRGTRDDGSHSIDNVRLGRAKSHTTTPGVALGDCGGSSGSKASNGKGRKSGYGEHFDWRLNECVGNRPRETMQMPLEMSEMWWKKKNDSQERHIYSWPNST